MHAGNSKEGAVADHVNSKSETFQSISFGTNDISRWSSLGIIHFGDPVEPGRVLRFCDNQTL